MYCCFSPHNATPRCGDPKNVDDFATFYFWLKQKSASKLKTETNRRGLSHFARSVGQVRYGEQLSINKYQFSMKYQFTFITSQVPRLNGLQGAGEQRTEVYNKYGEGAAQTATPQSAKSPGGVACFAGKQAGAAGRLWWH